MSPLALPGYLRDTLLRFLPHRARTGLRRIGDPGPDDPVLLTGNFALTVRRLQETLRGRQAWLLVANSRGINVWCAAGGGHLTHHDVISVIRTSGIGERVGHRELTLPQLGATGIERRLVTERTGWTCRWGPARLEELPGYLDRGQRTPTRARAMTFPWWERLELAAAWLFWIVLAVAALVWPLAGWRTAALTAGALTVLVSGVFLALPWLDLTGWRRWPVLTGAGLLAGGAAAAGLLATGEDTVLRLALLGGMVLISAWTLAADLSGSTPDRPSSMIAHSKGGARVDLLRERCTGATDCVQVCPRSVLKMDGKHHKVRIDAPERCISCAACVVQCPQDALRLRFPDGTVVEPATLRRTRVNLLGKRSVALEEAP